MRTERECLEALQEAADRLGTSPTKAEYEKLGLTPASGTIIRVVGGWNDAKTKAGLETYDRADSGGTPVQPKPESVDLPEEIEWAELTGQQRWYYKNRVDRIARKDRRRARLRQLLYTYKDDHCACCRCGEDRPPCLDFHHPEKKTETISKMVNDGYSWSTIQAEIDRCLVLCANCHRIEHSDRGLPESNEPDNNK